MNAWERIQSDPEVDRSQIYPVPCKRGLKGYGIMPRREGGVNIHIKIMGRAT